MREEMLKDEGRLALSMFYLGYIVGSQVGNDIELDDTDVQSVFFAEEVKLIARHVSEAEPEKTIMALANFARTSNMTTVDDIRSKLLTDNMLRRIAEVSARIPLHGSCAVNLDAVTGLHKIISEYLEERGGN